MKDAAAVIAAASAFISLCFTIYLYVSTRRLLSPFERPTLALLGGKPGKGADGKIGYALTIKNTGQRPATGISVRVRAAPEADLAAVRDIPGWEPVHDYQPDAEMKLMLWPDASFDAITMMQVAIGYADGLSNKTFDREGYWLVIFPGEEGNVTGMNRQQRANAEAAWGADWPN